LYHRAVGYALQLLMSPTHSIPLWSCHLYSVVKMN
jgi:hypothetical protein